jgi:phosphate transport system permease protein
MNSRLKASLFSWACLSATLISVLLLFLLLASIVWEGRVRFNLELFTRMPSEFPARAGIKLAMVGSLWLITLTALVAVPVGVATAIYLEEYAKATRVRSLIQLNISNLAGVPSVVYGILGLGLFVRALALDRSVLAGALTLTLVVLPIIILAAQEALRSVPNSIRHASYALGATRWQTVWRQVLPAATPAIMTGVILALSRAIGEAAPLLVVGAVGTATFLPSSLSDEFSALPIQIYNWASRPQQEFHDVAGSAIIVLMVMLICMNAIAVYVRYRFARNVQW